MIAPKGLTYFPYQRDGIQWLLSRQNALLGDEMGLGKSIIICGVINTAPTCRNLIICPASLKSNWLRELEKWCPIGEYGIARGDKWPGTASVIINYDILHRHHDAIRAVEWDLLAVDEAHYCKDIKARRTQHVVGSKKVQAIQAKRKILMTGTPVVNRPIELYPLLRYLAPHEYPSYEAFGMRYCGGEGKAIIQVFGPPQNRSNWSAYLFGLGRSFSVVVPLDVYEGFEKQYRPRGIRVKKLTEFKGAENLTELHERLSTLMLRRKKADVLTDLPPKFRQVIELDASAKARKLIGEERKLWAGVKGYSEAIHSMDSANLPGNFEPIATVRRELAMEKLPMVIAHLAECIASVEKVVCFCHHKEFVAGLLEAFPSAAVVVGGLDDKRKQGEVDRFQGDRHCSLFIGSKAAAEGWTLTASSLVVMGETFWVPGVVSQMEDRCHRIGQTDSVTCQHLVLAGSFDVEIAKSVVRKQKVIGEVTDGVQKHGADD